MAIVKVYGLPEDVSEKEMLNMEGIIKKAIAGIEEAGESPEYVDVFFLQNKLRKRSVNNLVIEAEKLFKMPKMTKETVKRITREIVDSLSEYLEKESQIEVQSIRCVVEVSDLPTEMIWSTIRTYHPSSKDPSRR